MAKDITFSYSINTNNEPVINHVDFDVESGQFVAILGANGSGKSTFCKLLNGLLFTTIRKFNRCRY